MTGQPASVRRTGIERCPMWVLHALAALIVAAVVAMWVLILTGTIGSWSNWPWALAAGAISLLPGAWRWLRRKWRRVAKR